MQAQVESEDIGGEDKTHLRFALGKAFEDAEDYENSFTQYAKGNALFRLGSSYDPDGNTKRIQALKREFDTACFAEREGFGCDARDPIFIVGMPRSGSTLLEQILACHSLVEGTTELPDMITTARILRDEAEDDEVASYAPILKSKSADELRALGERYLQTTRIHRKTDRPLFIDKMPNNFLYVGLIHLILPNAKIIDARRHPLACGFSNFKQYYAQGQAFSYGLTEMGRFYHDYVDLMAHFDAVLPGRVHRVFYEDTVSDTERVVREVLAYCELDFEEACLRFFESDRPVRTASSEQVRQPIYRGGLEQWKHFENRLEPMRVALGAVLEMYPEVPRL
mgnify:CR=1 FL=1